jgi:predicted GIY-YIG superfamily endonuclease
MPRYAPGDCLELDYFFYVYELLDDHGLVFYVGMSRDPGSRFRSHANEKHCDNPEIAAEIARNQKARCRVASIHPTREEALDAEAARVTSTPGLLNDVSRYQRKMPKQRTSEFYKERRKRRALRDASKPLNS